MRHKRTGGKIMQNKNCNQYIEAIKLAAGTVQYKNLSVKGTIINTVKQLQYYYEESQDTHYLEVATLHIQAYLEMGFPYEEADDIFNKILEKLGTTKELRFPKKFYVAKKIKVNKTQVRSMIGRWPASQNQDMKIDEVVEDIINKIKMKECGIYYYQCIAMKDIYELVISEEEMFFHDLRRGIFYTFIQ